MRIAIAAGIFPPDIGGPATFVPRLATWLAGRGHHVGVVCRSDRPTETADGHYPFSLVRVPRTSSRLRRYGATVATLVSLARSADVVFANTLDLEAHFAARIARKPTLHKVVGDRAWEAARSRGWFEGTIDDYQKASKSPLLRALDRWRTYPLERATKIVVPSRYLAGIVAGWSGIADRPVRIVPNAAPIVTETARYDLPPHEGPTIVSIGRLVPWKQIDGVIGVLPRIPSARLVIAGDGEGYAHLTATARRFAVSERVIFLGRVSPKGVQSLLLSADALVLNSSYEGLPHVLLEAMAAGCPIVATDVGGNSEVVRHERTGLLIPSGDDAALVDALGRLFARNGFAAALAVEARRAVAEEFAESICFERYEALLAETAATGRSWLR